MGTKAQDFRAAAQRTSKHKDKQHQPHKPEAGRLSHNEAQRAEKKSSYAIEQTGAGAHASRKSTRGSANRSKSDSALRITARVKNASPEARARRKSGNPM